MKKTVLVLFIITAQYFLTGYSPVKNNMPANLPAAYLQFQNSPVPDVMGFVNVIESDGNNVVYNISESDSFPVFTGFPKTISGRTFEGGIVCNMDADLDFEIVYNIGFTVQAWNHDGSNVSRLAAISFFIPA